VEAIFAVPVGGTVRHSIESISTFLSQPGPNVTVKMNYVITKDLEGEVPGIYIYIYIYVVIPDAVESNQISVGTVCRIRNEI
jgi:hypothetical protein